MKTTGQILQTARIAKKLELDDVSRVTKIRPQFLQSIESDDFRNLPSGTVARGFIRNYSEFLNISPQYVLAIFKRDFVENPSGRIVPRGMTEPVEKVSFWTPRTTVIAIVVGIFILFGTYLIYQYRLLTGPPFLALSQPVNGAVIKEDNVEVAGKTDPEASIAVNGQLISLDKGGYFFFRLPLTPGPNTIVITATAKSGKTSTITRSVNLTSPPPPLNLDE